MCVAKYILSRNSREIICSSVMGVMHMMLVKRPVKWDLWFYYIFRSYLLHNIADAAILTLRGETTVITVIGLVMRLLKVRGGVILAHHHHFMLLLDVSLDFLWTVPLKGP